MPLPSVGPISLSQVNVELGLPANTPISLGQANVRNLAGVPSGQVAMSTLLGKSASAGLRLNVGTDGTGVGYILGLYGSITPTTLQGVVIYDIAYDLNYQLFWISVPTGSVPPGSGVIIKNESMVTTGAFSYASSSPFDSAGRTYYFWGSVGNAIGPAGGIRYVDVL